MYKVDQNRVIPGEDIKERRDELLSVVLDAVKQVKELDNAYVLRFASNQETFILLSDWLQLECKANPFLRCQLVAESNNGPIWVELSGPAGTKDFLMSELGISRWM